MGLRNLFEAAGKINLPDLGISERLGVSTSKPMPNQQAFNAFYGFKPNEAQAAEITKYPGLSSQPIPRPQVAGTTTTAQNPAGVAPSGGGALASNPDKGTPNEPEATQDNSNEYAATQQRLQQEADTQLNLRRQQAESAYNPLIASFNTRIGSLSGELEGLQGGIRSGAERLVGSLGKQRDYSLGKLDESQTGVQERGQASLRDVASDQRNLTTSVARKLGAQGAGDTSAGDYAGAAIGREGLKQTGNVRQGIETGIREIEGRRADVQNIFTQEESRIQTEKESQLSSLAKDYAALNRQYEDAKANASFEQQQYINNEQNKLNETLSQRLYDIDSKVAQRKAALEDWTTQQSTLLENSLAELAGKGAYDASNVYTQFDRAQNAISGSDYQIRPEAVASTYFPGANPSDLFEPKKDKDADPIDALIEQALGQGL